MFYYLNILQLICLINYVVTFPIFDELWETNQSEPQTINNPIESEPKIKAEPHEEQFDGRWQDESALKRNVKVEHEPHFGAVKVEGTDKIQHEFKWWDEESGEFKKQLEVRVKEEDQDGQAPNSSDHKKIGDNSNKHLSDQNNSTDQHKREIIQKFREIKDKYQKKNKSGHSAKEWVQSETKISNGLGVCRTTIYKWIKELGLNQEKFSVFEKRKILKQFDKIKSKCKAKFKNISMRELDNKIAKKLGIGRSTIYEWKREFDLSFSNKISDPTKFVILKKYAKIKRKNQKMTDDNIADILNISSRSLRNWKKQFKEELRTFK